MVMFGFCDGNTWDGGNGNNWYRAMVMFGWCDDGGVRRGTFLAMVILGTGQW